MSAPKKVTAYELALRLHNRRLEEVRSEEMVSVAAESGLVVLYPRWDHEKAWIGYFGAPGKVETDGEHFPTSVGVSLTLPDFIDLPQWAYPTIYVSTSNGEIIRCHIASDVPAVTFEVQSEYVGATETFGIVVDTLAYHDFAQTVDREAETRTSAEKRNDGSL